MRRWLLVFLVVLLPLRGLVGDAMAGEMIGMQMQMQTAVAQAQVDAPAAAAEAHHDCAGHEDAAAADESAPGADCATCAHCQACNAFGMALPIATLAGGDAIAHPVVAIPVQGHPSAERTRAFKPPIS